MWRHEEGVLQGAVEVMGGSKALRGFEGVQRGSGEEEGEVEAGGRQEANQYTTTRSIAMCYQLYFEPHHPPHKSEEHRECVEGERGKNEEAFHEHHHERKLRPHFINPSPFTTA